MEKNYQLKKLKKAILFLKRKEIIRNNTDLAVIMKISSSYLSQMLHGNKPFTEQFFTKFEENFNINLTDPFLYFYLDWVSSHPCQLPNSPNNSNALISSMKKLLKLKDHETKSQKKMIAAQQELILSLQKEIDLLKPVF